MRTKAPIIDEAITKELYEELSVLNQAMSLILTEQSSVLKKVIDDKVLNACAGMIHDGMNKSQEEIFIGEAYKIFGKYMKKRLKELRKSSRQT